jgi:hypothetical protein
MREICLLLDLPIVEPTVGSSVPRVFFSDVATAMGINSKGSMPETARAIIEASHLVWHEQFSSELAPSGGGGTVTALGLLQLKNAVLTWQGKPQIPLPANIFFETWSPVENWIELREGLVRSEKMVVVRQGASEFRQLILLEYEGRCAVTNFNSTQALEVAHIVPYYGPNSDEVQNAILLRSDIHKLFDAGLVRLEYLPSSREYVCRVHDFIREDYGDYDWKVLKLPLDPFSHPSKNALTINQNLHSQLWQVI